MMQIYLDHSATTPTRSEAITAMQQVLTQQWGNPSSLHTWGQRSATLVERARIKVGNLINTVPESIIFTSGGTEADNMAIMGVVRCYREPQHIIISVLNANQNIYHVKYIRILIPINNCNL